uniref:N/A n=1 Tax=Ganoderma boninense TaxID=34458 RepID=A0A5K1K1Q3_9APHY|nr:N/A [Ganoderma boninense]
MDTSQLKLPFPYDVLVTIASLADRNCRLAFLAASRSLHLDCGKYVLDDPVILHGDQSITSFISFMRPHNHSRWRHLRSLCLSPASISSSVAEVLVSEIPRATNLQSLQFEDAEHQLRAYPDLIPAFAALPAIKHIVIENGYTYACKMLEATHWPLDSAVFRVLADLSPWEYPDNDPQQSLYPATILRNSRATLRTLECKRWTGRDATLLTYPVYPMLESLSVVGVWGPRPAHWAISFPNLKRLTVRTVESDFIDMDQNDLAERVATRARNLNEYESQVEHWNELAQFHGDVLDFYLLGFTCRIQRMSLSLSAKTLQFFPTVMETARPTHLRLSISSKLLSQPIPTYLHDPGLADLKSLELDVDVWVGGKDGYEGDTDMVGFLGHVIDLLRRASTQQFTFHLSVQQFLGPVPHSMLSSSSWPEPGVSDEQEEPLTRPPASPFSPLKAWIKEVDLDALARRFFEQVSSLESVELQIWSRDPQSSSKSAQLSRVREPVDAKG